MGRLVFTDGAGGALASLAAALARAAGNDAVAEDASPRPLPPEIARALAEVGVTDVAAATSPAPRRPGDVVVTLGRGPSFTIDAQLYDGPETTEFGDTSLERMGLARIARDRVERWLELGGHSGSQSRL